MPYGPYDSFTNNFFNTLMMGLKFGDRRTPETSANQEIMKQAIEMAQANAKEGIAPQFQFEQVQAPGGRQALRMTEDSTGLYNMLGGEASVRGYEARAAQEMQKLEFNQKMTLYDKTDKAFNYLKEISANENISPDVKKYLRDSFVTAAGKVGVELGDVSSVNIEELEGKWRDGQVNLVGKLFDQWKSDPTPDNESFFLSALSRANKNAVDKDVWKTAYTTMKSEISKRPYQIGQVIPAQREGNLFVTRQVTGYDSKNMPVFREIARSPIREGSPEKEALDRESKYDLIVNRKLRNYFGTAPQINNLTGETVYPVNPETGKAATPQEYQAKANQFYSEAAGGKNKAASVQKIPGGYRSADEVKAAYQAGTLSKAAAATLLRKFFGMQ